MPLPAGSFSTGWGRIGTPVLTTSQHHVGWFRQACRKSLAKPAATSLACGNPESLPGSCSVLPTRGRCILQTRQSRSRSQQFVAASTAAALSNSQPDPHDWEHLTQRLVALSTVPFLLLMMPQVIKNASNFMAGNARALAALSWVVSPIYMSILVDHLSFALVIECTTSPGIFT